MLLGVLLIGSSCCRCVLLCLFMLVFYLSFIVCCLWVGSVYLLVLLMLCMCRWVLVWLFRFCVFIVL